MQATANSTTFDWEEILESISDEKCILFVGPQVYAFAQSQTVEQAMYSDLDAQNPEHPYIRNFYEEDGFFLFREKRFRRKVIRQMRKFYQQEFPLAQAVLQKLTQIPFRIIFQLSPDDLLQRAFRQNRLPFRHDLYFKNQPPQGEYLDPTTKQPLLYHMLGYLEEEESLVLTHNDLFDYLQSIFNAKSMHQKLQTELAQAHNYIFLGLPFEKWYMQLLLRVLSLHSEKLMGLERFAAKPKRAFRQKLYEEQFKIEFVPDESTAFINELYNRCAKANMLKPLPELSADSASGLQKADVMDLITKGKIKVALETFKIVLEQTLHKHQNLHTQLIVLMSRFAPVHQRIQMQMESEADKKEVTRITFELLQLLNDYE